MIKTLTADQLRDILAGNRVFLEEPFRYIYSPEGVVVAEIVTAAIQNPQDREKRTLLLSIRKAKA